MAPRLPSDISANRSVSACVPVILLLITVAQVLIPVSAQSVPKFVSGISVGRLPNDTSTGRITVEALSSPNDSFELVLIQDGFGTDRGAQYCWAEVHDTATTTNLKWRAPCNPLRVDSCTLILTSDGDFRLNVAVGGAEATAFLTDTANDGVVDVQLTNDGDLILVKADNSSVWKSSENLQRQQKCRAAFNPSNSSHRLALGPFVLVWTVALVSLLSIF